MISANMSKKDRGDCEHLICSTILNEKEECVDYFVATRFILRHHQHIIAS